MKSKSEDSRSSIVDFIEALAVALILALAIRAFLFQAFTIPSGSMLNTIQIGDYLLVNKFLYGVKIPFTDKYLFRGRDPQRGDSIVFKFPGDESVDYIKRIVGVPGDVIEVKNKQLYRNGEPLQESYLRHTHPDFIGRLDNIGPVTVPEDEIRLAIKAVYDLANAGQPVNATSLQSALQDEKAYNLTMQVQAENADQRLQRQDVDMYLERLRRATPMSSRAAQTDDDGFRQLFANIRREKHADAPPGH